MRNFAIIDQLTIDSAAGTATISVPKNMNINRVDRQVVITAPGPGTVTEAKIEVINGNYHSHGDFGMLDESDYRRADPITHVEVTFTVRFANAEMVIAEDEGITG
jgi:hypothetical protein